MDKKKSSSRDEAYARSGGERRQTYKGHEVVIPDDERGKRISIDGRSVHYGVTDGGEYYLDVYAYDRAKSLDEVVKRYIDYLERTERRKKEEK
jgi:hypothetical protein